jgi:hypothetical protein
VLAVYDVTEADEAATDKITALRNYKEIKKAFLRGEESYGVLGMYEQAALNMGWVWEDMNGF